MRMFLCVVAIATAFLLPNASFAQSKGATNLVFLRVPDSLKDTEIHLAKILLERLKVNSSLQAPKGKPEDVVLRAQFKAVEEKNMPSVVILIDTKIARRSDDGKPLAQVISITSFADIKLKQGRKIEILEWANKLNGQPVPMRVYISGDKVGLGRNLLNSVTFPLAENAVMDAFTRIYRAWGSMLTDLRKRDFIEP